MVQLNPEEGGVVVAVVRAAVGVQENESLYVYQSTKEIPVYGAGFDDRTSVRAPFRWLRFVSPCYYIPHLRYTNSYGSAFLVFLGIMKAPA